MSEKYVSKEHIIEYDANLQQLASSFRCGNSFIDNFLGSPIALDPGIGKTYVWLDRSESCIIGFYNITTGSIEEIKEGKIYKIGGAVHINEFVINTDYQKLLYDKQRKLYVSDVLLYDCIERIEYYRHKYLGFTFVTLSSTKEGYNLYCRNDFEKMDEDMQIPVLEDKEYECIPMYLPLDIEK